MVKKENGSKMIEQGDIFFFYRPKIGTEEVFINSKKGYCCKYYTGE
jgi:hypothetical protein